MDFGCCDGYDRWMMEVYNELSNACELGFVSGVEKCWGYGRRSDMRMM